MDFVYGIYSGNGYVFCADLYSCRLIYLLHFLERLKFNISFLRMLLNMLNLISLFCQTHNYRKPHPKTDGGNVEKHRPDTWTLLPKRILTSLTYIAECATNHSLRFSTGSEFSRTMEIRRRGGREGNVGEGGKRYGKGGKGMGIDPFLNS